jgi:predicted nucleic acid-binding protein
MRSGASIRASERLTTCRATSYTTVDFIDTNVLLYGALPPGTEPAKREVARKILVAREVATSVQVLQEFYTQATRPARSDELTHEDALAVLERLIVLPVQALSTELVLAAIVTCERYGISYWDAAIIEAARAIGCSVVLSEDLRDGQDYGGVRVENPFRGR